MKAKKFRPLKKKKADRAVLKYIILKDIISKQQIKLVCERCVGFAWPGFGSWGIYRGGFCEKL